MGNRLTKIYTRTGDKGSTALSDKKRISKDHPRIKVIGEIDELNSIVGIVVADSELDNALRDSLFKVQQDLFDLGGELSFPEAVAITENQILRLEQEIDEWNAHLPYLKEFILPGGSPTAAFCHLARAVCRRAERSLVSLCKKNSINPQILKYLNRLSDWLFVLARAINQSQQHAEIFWQHKRR